MALNEKNNEDPVAIGEVVGELSPGALRSLAGMGLLGGKFVRLEESIVVGPSGIKVTNGPFIDGITHRDLMERGLDAMGREFTGLIEAAAPSDSYLHRAWHLVDAGHYSIGVDEAGNPNRFALNGESIDYGKPDDVIRQRTGELARLALGEDFPVIAE
jgi:hypothetical protein